MSNAADRLDARLASVPASEGAGKCARISREAPPSVAEATKRLGVAAGHRQPWLTPAGLEALSHVPEVIGPATYQGVPTK